MRLLYENTKSKEVRPTDSDKVILCSKELLVPRNFQRKRPKTVIN